MSQRENERSETREIREKARKYSLVSLISLVSFSLFLSTLTYAQRNKPKLIPVRRDYFAGKILLIPRNDQPSSVDQPRMIAAVADHDLIAPPSSLIGDAEKMTAWAATIDDDEVDGAIISLETVSGAELIKQIRLRRPAIPIYGLKTLTGSSNQGPHAAIDLVAGRSLDFLIFSSENPELLTGLKNEISSRHLTHRIAFTHDPDSMTNSLLARMINIRFGFAPKILPVYSSGLVRESIAKGAKGQPLTIDQLINDRIRLLNGTEPPQTAEGARIVDVLLFVHTPQTHDQERVAVAETISQTIDRNVRIALVDLSESKESKDAMIAELRRRKLLDKLAAYASLDHSNEKPAEAVTRTLAHASSFLISIRFLRDDLDRVRRIDRAQVSLLLSRYLSDWAFVNLIRPGLEPSVRNPMKSADEVEAQALDQMKPVAEELFNDQFRRNAHAFLLSNGERAQFEIRMLQRLNLRLFLQSGRIAEVGIKTSIYVAHLGNMPAPQLRPAKLWRIFIDDSYERVFQRWKATDWQSFKTDVEMVEMAVKITSQPGLNSQEGYTILSKRSRDTRRIEITAPSQQGAFYAIGKLEQMGAEGQLAQDFQLNEKPASAERGIIESFSGPQWSHRERVGMIRFLGRVRINRYYYVPDHQNGRPTEQEMNELLRVADENFVQFVYGNKPDSSTSSSSLKNTGKTGDEVVCLNLKSGDLSVVDKNSAGFVINAKKQLQLTRLILATASEYAWYGRSVDPTRAFNSALNMLYDERTRSGVRAWSQILGDCAAGKRLTEQKLDELQAAIELIGVTRERGLLRGELARSIQHARAATGSREDANQPIQRPH